MKIEINEKREILITSIRPHVMVGSFNDELTDEAVREIENRLKLAEQFVQLMHEVVPQKGTVVSDLEIAVIILPKVKALFNQYR